MLQSKHRSALPLAAMTLATGLCASVVHAGPVPIMDSTITLRYPTSGGEAVFSGDRDYAGRFPGDSTVLDAASNIKVFNSDGQFGRRYNVFNAFPEVIGANETLITHSFFKTVIADDYFPGIPSDGHVTIEVSNIHFAHPVTLIEDTFLFHVFWHPDQMDQLPMIYHHGHGMHTLTNTFRDAAQFEAAHEFVMHPMPHHVLGSLQGLVNITGNGTDTLGISIDIPYDMFMHLHEMGQTVPDGLPAPHGFLEPFHFHLEYLVTPEPTSLLLLASGALWIGRARRRRVTG